MAYIYDNTTGRVMAIVRQGTPTVPSGFTSSPDAIDDEDAIGKKRNIGSGTLLNRDTLVISGAAAVRGGAVGQLAVKKLDGTTLEDKDDPADDDAVVFVLEHPDAFLNKAASALVNGAEAVKVAAPAVNEDARFLVFSPELVLLDTKVSFD